MEKETRVQPISAVPGQTVLEKDWSHIFPTDLDFYGLGAVQRLAKRPARVEKFNLVLSFELLGDEIGSCVVGFEEEPVDGFMAMELASIICARISAKIGDSAGGEMTTISPPTIIEQHQDAYTGLLNDAPVLYGYQLISDEMPYLNFRVATLVKKPARA